MDLQNPPTSNVAYSKFNSGFSQESERGNRGFRNQGQGSRKGNGKGNDAKNGWDNKPICQLYGKVGYVVVKCYHHFDINYQGREPNA